MRGYQERVYKAVEIAGGKVKRGDAALEVQSNEQIGAAMGAWVAATQHLSHDGASSR